MDGRKWRGRGRNKANKVVSKSSRTRYVKKSNIFNEDLTLSPYKIPVLEFFWNPDWKPFTVSESRTFSDSLWITATILKRSSLSCVFRRGGNPQVLNQVNMSVAETIQCCFWLEAKKCVKFGDRVHNRRKEFNTSCSKDPVAFAERPSANASQRFCRSLDWLPWETNSRCTIPRVSKRSMSILLHDQIERLEHTTDHKTPNFTTSEVNRAISLGILSCEGPSARNRVLLCVGLLQN